MDMTLQEGVSQLRHPASRAATCTPTNGGSRARPALGELLFERLDLALLLLQHLVLHLRTAQRERVSDALDPRGTAGGRTSEAWPDAPGCKASTLQEHLQRLAANETWVGR